MSQEKDPKITIKLIHILFCVVLYVYGVFHYTTNTPVIQVWRQISNNYPVGMSKLDRVANTIKQVAPLVYKDIALGATVITIFSFTTGVYVRRFQAYLKMQGSGQIADVRGLGIEAQTLNANLNRRGGID